MKPRISFPAISVLCSLLFTGLGVTFASRTIFRRATATSMPTSPSGLFGVASVTDLNESGDYAFIGGGGSAIFLRPAATGTIVRVLQMGDAIPGISGSRVDTIGNPRLNNSGRLAFVPQFSNSEGVFQAGIFTFDGANLQKVISSSDIAPGTGGAIFGRAITFAGMNNNGDIAFTGSLLPLGSSATAQTTLFIIPSGGSPIRVAGPGDVAPGTGGTFTNISIASGTTSLNNGGEVQFRAQIVGGSGGFGLFAGSTAGVRKVVTNGDAIPGGGTFSFASAPATSFNNSGQVAFSAANTIWIQTPATGIAKAVGLGDAAPATVGGTFSSSPTIRSFNDSGMVAFSSNLSGSSVTNSGLFRFRPSNPIETVMYVNQSAPGAGSALFTAFSAVSMSNSGMVSFQSSLSGGSSPRGIYSQSGTASSVKVALEGEASPVAGGGSFSFLNSTLTRTFDSGSTYFWADTIGGAATYAEFLGTSSALTVLMNDAAMLPPGSRTASRTFRVGAGGDYVTFAEQQAGGGFSVIVRNITTSVTTTVATTGDVAPGTGGARFRTQPGLGPASINSSGTYVFSSATIGGTQGVSSGIFIGTASGGVAKLVANGDLDPSTSSPFSQVNLDSPFPGPLNESGQVVFRATVLGKLGVYLGSPGGSFQRLVQVTDPAPGGGTFTNFAPPAINQSGQAVFFAIATGTSNQGIFVATPGSGVAKIAKLGDAAPGGGTFAAFASNGFSFNDSGEVAFKATLNGGPGGGAFVGTTSSLQSIALNGAASPVGGNFSLAHDTDIVINNEHDVVFRSLLTGGTSDSGYFLRRGAGGILQTVAFQGQAVPGTQGTFVTITPAVNSIVGESFTLGPTGEVAFTAAFQKGSDPFVGNFRFRTDNVLEKILARGEVVPNTGNGVFVANVQGMGAGGFGRFAFWAGILGGNVDDLIYVTSPAASATPTPTPTPCNVSLWQGLAAPNSFPAGTAPLSLAGGDFNHDGLLDLAVADADTSSLSVLMGTGAGSFGAPTSLALGASPYAVAVGDFNADQNLDLAIAGRSSGSVLVLLGNGPGTFTAPVSFAVGTKPQSVAVADFNHDGKLDIAAGNFGSNNVSVLLGNGTGGFGAATNFAVGTTPFSVAAGDFNHDGNLDLAAANFNSMDVSVLLGNGAGSFGAATNFALGANAVSVAVGDLNSDGNLDLAVATSSNVSVLLGDGAGGFGAAASFGAAAVSVSVGDFNGDGKLDLAPLSFASNSVSVLLGNGNGSFGTPADFAVGLGPESVMARDLNGDGKLDLAVANSNSDTVTIFLNNGWTCVTPTPTPTATPTPTPTPAPGGTIVVTTTNDGGAGSLRQAILDANDAPGLQNITFNIPGSGVQTISPALPLPQISDSVVIDGYTQPGASPNTLATGDNAVLLIQIDGTNAGTNIIGLQFTGGNSRVRGLVINRFNAAGMRLDTNGGNIVEGNFLGTSADGTVALGNRTGVSIFCPNNLVGGQTPAARNIISGNLNAGVFFLTVPAASNQVQGNYIGTDASGTAALANLNGLSLGGGPNNLVGGTTSAARNVISGNGTGILIQNSDASGNQVQGNFIGTNASGNAALANANNGVEINAAPGNTIGGTSAGARNIISGNQVNGVSINGAGASGNAVQGNFIGTDLTGTVAIANSTNAAIVTRAGLLITNAPNNLIGGTASGAGNLISGNADRGLTINGTTATANVVQGNFVGTNASGSAALGNVGTGVTSTSPNNIIGGTTPGARNIISGNGVQGITIFGSTATGNLVQGNYIGTNVSGNAAIPNTFRGIAISNSANNNVIGGATLASRNLISGNNSDGILILNSSSLNTIQGNLIGTDSTGTSALANVGNGIWISSSSNNLIGGSGASAANTIAFNTSNGVLVNSGLSNGILSNSIFANGGLGINLSSANNNQAAPVLSSAVVSGGHTTIYASLNSAPNTTFNVQFFANNVCDPSGSGEGQTLLGSTSVATGPFGDASIGFIYPAALSTTQIVTATATDSNNNTSGFSACQAVVAAVPTSTTIASSLNPSLVGQPVTFTANVTSSGGTPTGVVEFFDSGQSLGVRTLSAGSASLTTGALTSGSHQITAVYSGTAVFVSSSSSALTQTVTVPGCDDTWIDMRTTNAPTARTSHVAVWTGSEMIVWGGASFFDVNTGARYSPNSDNWIATSLTNAPIARDGHTGLWTGTEMIIWGGRNYISNSNPANPLNSGGRYNPAFDSWITTSTTNAPASRMNHTAVWTGTEMIVWGGLNNSGYLNSGGRYNPSTNSWTPVTTTNAPVGRIQTTSVWTGNQMIIWGGRNNGTILNTGAKYNPATNTWTPVSSLNAPTARYSHTAVWTGSEMIVWGGYDNSGQFMNTGARYNPSTDTWTPLSTTNAPIGRFAHTAVWTGSEMIVWGGANWSTNNIFNSGGRYNPATNTWADTSLSNVPVGRLNHTAVWTGDQMFVWGGNGIGGMFNTGGKYCASTSPPPTPTRTPTTTTISSSLNPSIGGQSVTFSASVTSGNGAPSGTIEFFDYTQSLAVVSLSGGTASLITPDLAAGSHSITAHYSGDSNFLPSISPALIETVAAATPVGSNVAVQETAGAATVSISFPNVTVPGNTSITPIDPGSTLPVPGGFILVGESVAFEVSTTSSFIGPATVCFQVPSVNDPAEFSNLRILHSAPWLDLATANSALGSNNATVIFGGGFGSPSSIPVGGDPRSIAVGDFNGDGNPDLVVGRFATDNVAVYLGNGLGGFGPATNFAIGGVQGGIGGPPIAVGDLNSDGKQDLVVINYPLSGSPRVSILLGNGTGGFGSPTHFVVGNAPNAVALGDFNMDGKIDLVISSYLSDLSIMLGNGQGGFSSPAKQNITGLFQSVAVGDFNGDGKSDLAVANYGLCSGNKCGAVSLLLGNGSGGFGLATNFNFGSAPVAIVVGDFNADGKLDVATANASGVTVLPGTGTGSLGAASYVSKVSGGISLVAADFNNDGKLDLATADSAANKVFIRFGQGTGNFQVPAGFAVGTAPHALALGNFNRDSIVRNQTILSGPNAPNFATRTICAQTLSFSPFVIASVLDQTPPTITNVSVSPEVIWPPNHQMVDVAINYDVSDDFTTGADIRSSIEVSSNEPVNTTGDGDTEPDIEIVDAHHVRLRAERSGSGNGRVYTITITSKDAAQNSTREIVVVVVPNNK